MADSKEAEGAFHEAGHTTVAAALGMVLTPHGIHIDQDGNGISFYVYCHPGIQIRGCQAADEELVLDRGRKSVISFFAGLIAQREFCRSEMNKSCSNTSAARDNKDIETLLGNLYWRETSAARKARADELEKEAKNLVLRNWEGIKALAEALLKEPRQKRIWEPDRTWSSAEEEKRIDGIRIRGILLSHGIDALLQPEAD